MVEALRQRRGLLPLGFEQGDERVQQRARVHNKRRVDPAVAGTDGYDRAAVVDDHEFEGDFGSNACLFALFAVWPDVAVESARNGDGGGGIEDAVFDSGRKSLQFLRVADGHVLDVRRLVERSDLVSGRLLETVQPVYRRGLAGDDFDEFGGVTLPGRPLKCLREFMTAGAGAPQLFLVLSEKRLEGDAGFDGNVPGGLAGEPVGETAPG